MRPPLLQFGGEDKFADYQAEFDRLFPEGRMIDVLGNEVIFTRDRCEHVCFKSDDAVWNRGQRNVWSPERAERILWIAEVIANPDFIRIDRLGIWAYMSQMERDKVNNLPGELYAVTMQVDSVKPGKPGKVYFLTAHPITVARWDRWKVNKPWVYPPDEPEPPKSKKGKNKK